METKEQLLAHMDPELRPFYEMMPEYSMTPYDTLMIIRHGAEAMRQQVSVSPIDRDDLIFRKEQILPEDLEVRVYEPVARKKVSTAILYFHGGGCVLGTAEQDDAAAVSLALEYNTVVFNVNYRCAPEFPAPAGQLDAVRAWKWLLAEGMEKYSINTSKVVFYGGSGGANIAIGAALRILDEGEILPAGLIVPYPMIDDRGITVSSQMDMDTSLWGRGHNQAAWNYLLHGLDTMDTAEADAYIAPARRTDLRGLPPVLTFVGSVDILRDETIAFVQHLAESDVDVEFSLYPGAFHGFDVYVPEAGCAKRAAEAVRLFLQKRFA